MGWGIGGMNGWIEEQMDSAGESSSPEKEKNLNRAVRLLGLVDPGCARGGRGPVLGARLVNWQT